MAGGILYAAALDLHAFKLGIHDQRSRPELKKMNQGLFKPSLIFHIRRKENDMKKTLISATTMIILCMSSGFATAGDYGGDESKSWGKKGMEKMMMGKHSMSGTITNIDQQTGLVTLKTGVGDMTVHFPQESIKDLKNGDAISVHLSFSKGDEMMMKGEKKMMMDEKKMMK